MGYDNDFICLDIFISTINIFKNYLVFITNFLLFWISYNYMKHKDDDMQKKENLKIDYSVMVIGMKFNMIL